MSIVKLNNNSVKNATAFGSITGLGDLALIKTVTASSSASISFVDGASSVVLDGTYKEYIFTFNNIHPATDNTTFTFNLSVDGGSNYNVAKTTTVIRAFHDEGDSSTELDYLDGLDLAQGTGVQALVENIGNGNDESVSGFLRLFEPSSTTFVKHLIWEVPSYGSSNAVNIQYGAGYGNTTSAVDAIQFTMGSGNIDAGTISLYGVN
jgi:hypothetical protein